MEKFKKYENNNLIKIIIFGLFFLTWLIPFIFKEKGVLFANIMQLILAFIAMLSLILFKNNVYVLEIILFYPFSYAHTMDLKTIPIYLYLAIGLVILGLIIHYFLYKPKFKFPIFLVGFVMIGISLVLGGLTVEMEDAVLRTLLLIFIALAFLIIYSFLSSTVKISFKEVSYLMSFLGLFLILQLGTFALIHTDTFLSSKNISLGWADNSNSLAMILLFTFPFMYYLVLKGKKSEKILFGILAFVMLISLVFTYSRGALAAGFLSYIFFAIFLICKKETRKETLIYLGIIISVALALVLITYLVKPNLIKAIIEGVTKIDLDNLNGRKPIYDYLIKEFFKEPIFGFGIFKPYEQSTYDYLWGHNLFIQTAYTLGIMGLFGISYHLVQKYAFCFKNFSLEKLVFFVGFLAPDLYGLIDVSYFFINFMIVLFVLLIAAETCFKEGDLVGLN